MIGYVVRRAGQAAVVVWLVVTVVFVMLHVLPGSTARVVLGPRAYPAEIAAFNRANGLDEPLPVQYGRFLLSVLHGQLTFATPQARRSPYEIVNDDASGVSLQQLVTGPLANTLLLMGLGLLVSVPLGLALGTWLAAGPGPAWLRTTAGLFSQAGYAVPVMVLAVVLTQVLALDLGLLPINMIRWQQGDVVSEPAGLVLPVLTVAIGNVALFSRYFGAGMGEALTSDYALKARAVGASRWRVLSRHAARNAAIPVVTLAATRIPMIFSVQVPLEATFQYPGIGDLAWQAATGKQYYPLLAAVLLVGVLVVASTFAADLVYLALDPRVSYSRTT